MIDNKIKDIGLPSHIGGLGAKRAVWEARIRNDPTLHSILRKTAKESDVKHETQIEKTLSDLLKNGDYNKMP